MTYLIVDDHPMTRRALIESLDAPGEEFAEAATGEEAVAYCERRRPDWIIMDVKMPGKGGLSATAEIVARRPSARVIVISQCDDRLIEERARDCGAIDFVSKDCIAELPAILERLSTT